MLSSSSIRKRVYCDICKIHLTVDIPLEYLQKVSQNGLFNYVVLHAADHALILSVDHDGKIRRTRTAALDITINNPSSALSSSASHPHSSLNSSIPSSSSSPPHSKSEPSIEFDVFGKAVSLSEAFTNWLTHDS